MSAKDLIDISHLPAGWKAVPAWTQFRRTKRTGFENEELLSVYRDFGVIPKSSRDDNHNVESEDLSGYQLVERGDLVLNKMKTWQGSIAFSEYRGIVSPAYFVYQNIGNGHARYLHYLLRSSTYIAAYNRISKGVRVSQWDLEPQEFRKLPIIFPPVPEQRRIADYLDRELEQIDALVKKNRHLIELLSERRNSVIDYFLRGRHLLHPTAGADELPEGWITARLDRYCSDVIDCLHSTAEFSENENANFLVVRTSCIRQGRFDPEQGYFTDEKTFTRRNSRGVPQSGDIFLTREAPAGEACLVPDGVQTCLGQRMVLLKVKQDLIHPHFIVWNIYAPHVRAYLDTETSGSMVQNLTIPRIRRIPIIQPPKNVQVDLLNTISNKTASIDLLIQKAEDTVRLMSERRQALVTDAVTRGITKADS